jgi:CDP-diacylglycerol--glycerol-3-phosphate 3-phosphatidyltransferase
MNVANQITFFRILLIPIIVYFFQEKLQNSYAPFIGTTLFIIAAITDAIDGTFARKYGEVTNLGKLFDPVADKMLMIISFTVALKLNYISIWVLIIIIFRELLITQLRMSALSLGKDVISASFWGKFKTGLQIASLVTIFVFHSIISIFKNNNLNSNIISFDFFIYKFVLPFFIITTIIYIFKLFNSWSYMFGIGSISSFFTFLILYLLVHVLGISIFKDYFLNYYQYIIDFLMIITVFITVYSGYLYFKDNIYIFKNINKEKI